MSRRLTPQEEVQVALGVLEEYVRDESIEAVRPAYQVETVAFDMGYQHTKLPEWLLILGRHFRVDVQREWQAGRESRTASVARRVASRFANQAPGARQEAKRLTHPINKPKGIAKDIADEHGRSVNHRQDTLKPERRDIRPEDVFAGTPNQMGVRNLAETGNDLQKALDKQVPKDKGHDAVSNLSQYLIRTEGGGGAKPAGK